MCLLRGTTVDYSKESKILRGPQTASVACRRGL